MKKKKKKEGGFTLIELIVVIVIIGILASTMLPRIMGSQTRARDTHRMNDLHQLAIVLDQYYMDYGMYPSGSDCIEPLYSSGFVVELKKYFAGSNLPTDPKKSWWLYSPSAWISCVGSYYYRSLSKDGSSNQAYFLLANMEDYKNDNQKTTGCLASKNSFTQVQTCITDNPTITASWDSLHIYLHAF